MRILTDKKMELLHKDMTNAIIKAFYKVYNQLFESNRY